MSRSKAATNQQANKLEVKKSDVTQDYINRLRKKSCGHRRQNSEFDRKRVQTVRLTMTIIATNFFLWMPFCLVNMVQAFKPGALSPTLSIYVMILGNLNSCVNPWVYILFNRSQAVKALCGRRAMGYSTHRSETDMLSSSRRSDFKFSVINSPTQLTPDGIRVHRNVSFQEPATRRAARELSCRSDLPQRKRAPASLYGKRSTALISEKSQESNGCHIVLSTDSSSS
ncbi:7 transmembrane receptor [Trichostrongylus colubriformis]|uniref:7 transmembrane receptor n=1 Tax=Trichostrongylus colubriformis TaxID=6319 RepID=A0AAN8FTS5_TRICO